MLLQENQVIPMDNLIAILKAKQGLNHIGMMALDDIQVDRTVINQSCSDGLIVVVKTMDSLPYPELTSDLKDTGRKKAFSMFAKGRTGPGVKD
jgi:hypothetical protein